MSSAPTGKPTTPVPPEPSVLAAVLSLLIPGLGQLYQGRFGKGFLFMISLLGMFHLGQAMGNWQNVYVQRPEPGGRGLPGLLLRWHYAGQFWIGLAAWPALWHHFEMPIPGVVPESMHHYQKPPNPVELNRFLINSDKTPDLGWVYTVIAGMLNILVIYDAYAGPAFAPLVPRPATREQAAPSTEAKKEGVV